MQMDILCEAILAFESRGFAEAKTNDMARWIRSADIAPPEASEPERS